MDEMRQDKRLTKLVHEAEEIDEGDGFFKIDLLHDGAYSSEEDDPASFWVEIGKEAGGRPIWVAPSKSGYDTFIFFGELDEVLARFERIEE